jgi:DNA-binding NarL/FixJ family response regulator
MANGLDVIVVDDDPLVVKSIVTAIKRFYTWGEVVTFTDSQKAVNYCMGMERSVAIFILDVFMDNRTGFSFLDSINEKFPMACEDTIIITGEASDDVVNMCIAAEIHNLIEKPIKFYPLQFAVRAIVSKYLKFAKKILDDPSLISDIEIG